jgi:hypothetical protein
MWWVCPRWRATYRTCEQPWQTTTVLACEKTVVMLKHPGHLTSMKKERGAGTSVLSLCLRASLRLCQSGVVTKESGVCAYAAGEGLRRSTARTWGCCQSKEPIEMLQVRGVRQRDACRRFRGELRRSCGPAHESPPRPCAVRRSSNSPFCRCLMRDGCGVDREELRAMVGRENQRR